jgi:hypothetical protein
MLRLTICVALLATAWLAVVESAKAGQRGRRSSLRTARDSEPFAFNGPRSRAPCPGARGSPGARGGCHRTTVALACR